MAALIPPTRMPARKPVAAPLQPELIRFGHSNHEFNASKYFGNETPFPLNYLPNTSKPLPSPANDKLYQRLIPIPTPNPIKTCCAICHLYQMKHFCSSASSSRFTPVLSEPVFMLQDSVVFHEACLYAYLCSDNMVPVPTRQWRLYEKLKELKDWVVAQAWNAADLEKALDRVLEKAKMGREGSRDTIKRKDGFFVV